MTPPRYSNPSPPTAASADGPGILLLCPPGPRVYHRDNYCSHEVKASYYWHPYDLVAQSGILSTVAPVEVLDATALKLNPVQALARLVGKRYRAILALVGGVCWTPDTEFLRRVEAATGAPLFISGDVPRAHPREVLDALPFVTGILLDFTSHGLASYLLDDTIHDSLILRGNPARSTKPLPEHAPTKGYAFPIPRWELFPPHLYRLPFQTQRSFASVGASFGCPARCSFCTASSLGFKCRDLDNLFEELWFLRRAGYREIHFRDLSFAADPTYCATLLERMIRESLGLTFSCLARADSLGPDLVRLLKRAGCHLVHIGVESASVESLRRTNKRLLPIEVQAAVDACRKHGIKVVASYVLGLPWETRADVERTIDFAIALGTDFASFNTYTVRAGWPAPDREYPPRSQAIDYDLEQVRHHAYRRFYFRLAYLTQRMRSRPNLTNLRLAVENGWSLFRQHAGS